MKCFPILYSSSILTYLIFCSSSGGPCGDGFNQGSVAVNTPARSGCFLGSDVGSCGTRHFTFGLDVTKPLNDGMNSYYRGQGPVTFKIVEAPAASNVGPVSTGGGDELSSGMGFVIVREKTQPTVMFPVPVCIYQLPKRFLGYVSHTNGFVLIAFCRERPVSRLATTWLELPHRHPLRPWALRVQHSPSQLVTTLSTHTMEHFGLPVTS